MQLKVACSEQLKAACSKQLKSACSNNWIICVFYSSNNWIITCVFDSSSNWIANCVFCWTSNVMQLPNLCSEIPFNYCVFHSAKYCSLVSSLFHSAKYCSLVSSLLSSARTENWATSSIPYIERMSEVGYRRSATSIQFLPYYKTNLFLYYQDRSENYWIHSCQPLTFNL